MSAQPASFEQIRATYRLQFHRGFTFRDATELVPYLSKLGISHVYASSFIGYTRLDTRVRHLQNQNPHHPERTRGEVLREFRDIVSRQKMRLIRHRPHTHV